ncbi:NuA4 histone H4 acetyltransferase complex and the SWR1 complex subunit [Geranomyces variabilis]|uniref:Protein AF-9 homolog n=1 Tax=Geranomyces variabilis TaxID=109894 RepID=A0AAD5TF39_9FUNG|nr:NuA4 histone H4 acetyltransferase complex and the SWR1 complex subunit [Geranomyces variabilis]
MASRHHHSRLKGVSHSRPILYGTHASLLKPNDKRADPSHTHKWTVFVRPVHPNEDLSLYIKRVQFKLHESFDPPLRTCDAPPYEVHETGWGEFDIPIKITIHESLEPRGHVQLTHTLQLYPKENADGAGGSSGAAAAAAAGKPVVSERYEEIVFNEPTEETYRRLAAHPVPVMTKRALGVTHVFTPATEAEELGKLKEACEKVEAQLERDRHKLAEKEAELARLKASLGED